MINKHKIEIFFNTFLSLNRIKIKCVTIRTNLISDYEIDGYSLTYIRSILTE